MCPGNRSALPHGCLFLWYGRTRLDKADILFSFKINERVFSNAVQKGQDRANMVLALFKLLDQIRQTDTYESCAQCGIGRTTPRPVGCETTATCQERIDLATQVLKTSYLRFPEFRATARDVYLLARKSTLLEQRAHALNANINELLGLDERTTKAFLDIMPVA